MQDLYLAILKAVENRAIQTGKVKIGRLTYTYEVSPNGHKVRIFLSEIETCKTSTSSA